MITPRCWATAVGHRGTLMIVGGEDNKYNKLATTELFNSTTGQWYTTTDLPSPHYGLKSVVVNNLLYLLGGTDENRIDSEKVFSTSLDTLTSHHVKWSSQQDTPCTRSAPVNIQGRYLLTVGGLKEGVTSDIHMFNKISYNWEVIGRIPSARSGPAVVNVAVNKIVVVGGMDDKYNNTNTVWIGSCEPQ